MSKVCRDPVQIRISRTKIGYRDPTIVKYELPGGKMTHDKVWTNIEFGQTLDKSWISLVVGHGPPHANCSFDRLGTNIGHGQTLNISYFLA